MPQVRSVFVLYEDDCGSWHGFKPTAVLVFQTGTGTCTKYHFRVCHLHCIGKSQPTFSVTNLMPLFWFMLGCSYALSITFVCFFFHLHRIGKFRQTFSVINLMPLFRFTLGCSWSCIVLYLRHEKQSQDLVLPVCQWC